MQTSLGARASASGSHIRRFSFRRACEWNLAIHRARGSQGRGLGARRQRGEGARPPPASRRRVPTTGPCGMLYWRSTAASSASDRTA